MGQRWGVVCDYAGGGRGCWDASPQALGVLVKPPAPHQEVAGVWWLQRCARGCVVGARVSTLVGDARCAAQLRVVGRALLCVCGCVPLRLVSDPAEGPKRVAAAWAGLGMRGRPGLRWGGGRLTTGVSPWCRAPHQKGIGAGGVCAAGPQHRLLAPPRRRGERRDISPLAAPGGWLSRVRPQAGGGWFNWGLMSIHGPGRMGEGPNSRPRRFFLAVCVGGGTRIFVFWEVSSPQWLNPGGLIASGNLPCPH